VVADTLTAELNDMSSLEALFAAHAGRVAAVIVEPVVGNAGLIPPEPGFLQGLLDLAHEHDALLILDEVMTGFRLAPGGAQELYALAPDLTTMGKVIGGGLPIGALGGRRDVMQMLAPVGPVYQAGTLSGNPVAVAAGLATLKLLGPDVYARLEALAARLESGVRANLKRLALPWQYQRVGSMACLFFTDRPVRCWADADSCDRQRFAAYCRAMLSGGIYLPPSQFETFFISAAHTEEDVDRTIGANARALRATI
jgi:glutamate-1-semialdehyde 2,1-aminomutase